MRHDGKYVFQEEYSDDIIVLVWAGVPCSTWLSYDGCRVGNASVPYDTWDGNIFFLIFKK